MNFPTTAPAFGVAPGNPQAKDFGYGTDYANMQKAAQESYGQVMSMFQQQQADQQARMAALQAGYGTLKSDVYGQIAQQEKAQREAISAGYEKALGNQRQMLADRGLSNTSIAATTDLGVLKARTREDTALSGTMAGQYAQAGTQIGLAGLGAQGQGDQSLAALGSQATGYAAQYPTMLHSILPQATQYASLALQRQQQEEAKRQFDAQQPVYGLSHIGDGQTYGSYQQTVFDPRTARWTYGPYQPTSQGRM